MTDNEIIKALLCCYNDDCKNCPNRGTEECRKELMTNSLDLIKRQQQDISTLKTKCYCISNDRDRIKKRLEVVSRDLQEGSARLTEAEREKFWQISNDEIREFWLNLYTDTVPENVKQIIPANMLLKLGHVSKSTIDLLKRQHADNEDLTERLNATIAGQESLQKTLAEKDREVSVLNSDLKLLRNDYDHLKKNLDETIERNKRLRDKVVRLTAEKDSLIKTFGECQAEAVREFAERLRQNKFTHKNFGQLVYVEDIDNLVKEMAGNKE